MDDIKQDSCCQKGVLLAGIEVNQIGFSKKGVGCGCYMIVGCYVPFFFFFENLAQVFSGNILISFL